MKRERLLVISHDFTLTGAPIALFNLVLGLSERFSLTVVSNWAGPLRQDYLDRGIAALVVPHLMDQIDMAAGLMLSFDAMLANTIVSFVAIHAASQMGKPSLWSLHEGSGWQGYLKKSAPAAQALTLASRLVVPCEYARELYAPWRSDGVSIIPYGVRDQPAPLVPEPPPDPADGSPKSPIHVLLLGTYQSRKGQDTALAAMQLINDDGFSLEMVGQVETPEFFAEIRRNYADLRQAKFNLAVPMEQTPAIIAACDILIVPSRDDVTPMVILEAMALGKPVIASRIGGMPEMIVEGQTGFLFPADDANALADLIKRLGGDAELRRRIGENARQFVRSERGMDQYAGKFAEIITEIIGSGKA